MSGDDMLPERSELLSFLSELGVDTRFVSVTPGEVLINNLRFSRFSRRREELFRERFPDVDVVRSKVFQKICSRASRVLSSKLRPRSEVRIDAEGEMATVLHIILEPYTRKYGIGIGEGDVRVLPGTLDHSIAAAVEDMLSGERIGYHLRSTPLRIYPLSGVPAEWIEAWRGTRIEVTGNPLVKEFLEFFDGNIPQFRDKMKRSLEYLGELPEAWGGPQSPY